MIVYVYQHYSFNLSPSLLPPLRPQDHALRLCLYSCPANKFISTIFLDSRFCMYNIWYLFFSFWLTSLWASLVVQRLKSACNAGDLGLIPGLGRSPGEGNGNPLQYSCLENPMGGGAWWDTVHGVAKSRTRLSDFTHSLTVYNRI